MRLRSGVRSGALYALQPWQFGGGQCSPRAGTSPASETHAAGPGTPTQPPRVTSYPAWWVGCAVSAPLPRSARTSPPSLRLERRYIASLRDACGRPRNAHAASSGHQPNRSERRWRDGHSPAVPLLAVTPNRRARRKEPWLPSPSEASSVLGAFPTPDAAIAPRESTRRTRRLRCRAAVHDGLQSWLCQCDGDPH